MNAPKVHLTCYKFNYLLCKLSAFQAVCPIMPGTAYMNRYRNLPIKGASPNKGAPIVWKNPVLSQMAKIDIVSLIIVRFSIRNHHWKAENLSFLPTLSDLTLLERPAPLLGRLRYVTFNI